MKKTAAAILFLSASLVASDISYPGLSAHVVHIADDDTLNIRIAPDYHSKKVGTLPPDAFVGIDHCKQIGKSTWCKIFNIGLDERDYGGWNASPGWVNAYYLQFQNRGYVRIKGKAKCYYLLGCKKGKCDVVTAYKSDPKTHAIHSLHIEAIAREDLSGTLGDGYTYHCNNGSYIEVYLDETKKRQIAKKSSIDNLDQILAITDALYNIRNDMGEAFAAYIHPVKGVVMTWDVHFGTPFDLIFQRADILALEKEGSKKIDWGKSPASGKKITIGLYNYMLKLTRPFQEIEKVVHLQGLKGFKCAPQSECRAYEIFWQSNDATIPEYSWQGLVVVLERYYGKWYVVGILRDRWTV